MNSFWGLGQWSGLYNPSLLKMIIKLSPSALQASASDMSTADLVARTQWAEPNYAQLVTDHNQAAAQPDMSDAAEDLILVILVS